MCHRACHRIGDQSDAHLDLRHQIRSVCSLRQLYRRRAGFGIDAAHRAADGHPVDDRLRDAVLLGIGQVLRNDLLIDDPQGRRADLTVAFLRHIPLQILPHELYGILAADTPLCFIGVKEPVAVHAGLALIQVEVGCTHAQPVAQGTEHIRIGRMIRADLRS